MQLKHLLNENTINNTDFKIIIKMLLVLNNSEYREENSGLLADYLVLLKDNFSSFSVNDLLTVYDVFHKIYEPADILNEIQRTASKFLKQLEEESSPFMEVRLKLLMAGICFLPPINRPQLIGIIKNYLRENLAYTDLILLGKIIYYSKLPDESINNVFWNKILTSLIYDKDFKEEDILKVCYYYVSFYNDVGKYRNFNVENKLNKWVDGVVKNGVLTLYPRTLCSLANFVIVFSRNEETLSRIYDKLQENQEQINLTELASLTKSLHVSKSLKYGNFNFYYNKIAILLDDLIAKKSCEQMELTEFFLYIKSCMYLDNGDKEEVLENVEKHFAHTKNLSSRTIKAISQSLYLLNTLVPGVIDEMVGYVIKNQQRLLGFTAERIINLCYQFGYTPKESEAFFEAITNILIRDQERLSGLSYLQTCLALCFFQKLPASFIKQIFNVYFLERLDTELAHCYYKVSNVW